MKPAEFAKVLAPHINDGWEHVVDVTRPGAAAKVAAVRAGNATTPTLDAATAARVAAEVADPAAVTAGETRRTVLAAANGENRQRRSPTAALFDGEPDEVHTKVTARSTATDAMIDAYLDAPREIRDLTATHMASIAETAGVAAVIAERAAALGPEAAVTWYENLHQTLRTVTGTAPRHRSNASDAAERQLGRLPDATATALTGWLQQHAPAAAKLTSTHTPATPPAHIEEGAGPAIAAIAAAAGVTFAGPAELGAAALTHSTHRLRFRSAAASGITWAQMRDAVHAQDDPYSDDLAKTLNVLRTAVEDRPHTDTFIVELTSTEFGAGYTGPTTSDYNLQHALGKLSDLLDAAARLRLATIAGDHSNPTWAASPVITILEGCGVAAAGEILAADELTAGHVRRVLTAHLAAKSPLNGHMWRHTLTHLHTRDLATLAAANPEVAARLAVELAQRVDVHAAGDDKVRGELWQAVCVIAPTLAGTIENAVDTAAATLGV